MLIMGLRNRSASKDAETLHNDSSTLDLLATIPDAALPGFGLVALAKAVRIVDDAVHSNRLDGVHACVADVVVTSTVPGVGSFESRWCLWCLEDTDPLDALYRLVPGSSVSVRAGA